MSHLVKRITVPIALALALLAGPALAGCSVQNLVHDVTGGKVDVPGKSVPKDFPGEVPLSSGEVLSGAGVGDAKSKIWNVSVRAKGNTAIDEVLTTLTSAGFTCKTLTATTADGGALVGDKGKLNVAVVEIKDDKGFVLNYTVTRGDGK
ncbi:hypothetical protein [Glaciihabitans sp. GrIS 2.15]|uniref:hypothetical protein n=1 Tax=Glaciihabitans sp. GrIS 2.15 TaxID=3071710 RepID=UPI002DFF027A|nr:hypothetical protein [Glaciihabitans sp. GrIS 2.15]